MLEMLTFKLERIGEDSLEDPLKLGSLEGLLKVDSFEDPLKVGSLEGPL